jgi:hypothetical protein
MLCDYIFVSDDTLIDYSILHNCGILRLQFKTLKSYEHFMRGACKRLLSHLIPKRVHVMIFINLCKLDGVPFNSFTDSFSLETRSAQVKVKG